MADGGARASEADVIAAVRTLPQADCDAVELGIGDDTAVLRPGGPQAPRQLATTDLLVEGVHFDLRYMRLSDAGWKALAVNISDIASMGGTSRYALGNLGLPPGATRGAVEELLAGVRDCAAAYGVQLVGGDTVAAPQWLVGFTLLGGCAEPPLLRSGARTGDGVWLSRPPGLAQLGLHCLWGEAGGAPPLLAGAELGAAVAAHCHPLPAAQLGPLLPALGASACLDTSDSLAQSLLHLAAASNTGLRVKLDHRVFPAELSSFAAACRAGSASHGPADGFVLPGSYDPSGAEQRFAALADFALASSEDYALLFTLPADAAESGLPGGCLRIGTVCTADEGCSYCNELGAWHELRPAGWQHR